MASMIHILEETPVNNETGKVWIKPSIGQAYIYINSSWVPLVGSPSVAIAYTYPLTFLIRGIDRTLQVKNMNALSKTDALTSQIDTLNFKLWDENRGVLPREGEEVRVFKQASVGATPTIWFGGHIDKITPNEIAPGQHKFLYDIKCVDYGKRLNKRLVVNAYNEYNANNNTDDDDIINEICEDYATEFTTYNVSYGITIDEIVFDYKPGGECIRDLAERSGYEFYVDYNKDIHYLKLGDEYAPYHLEEDVAVTGHYKNLRIPSSKAQLKNRVFTRGGKYLASAANFEFTADGIQTTFNLPYKPRNPITVYVDIGAGYVLKTLGVDDLKIAGADFVVNYTEGCIKNLDHATLTAGHKLKVNMKREVQVLTQDDAENSQQEIMAIEGGDGLYEELESVPKITTLSGAHEHALAKLNRDSVPAVTGSFYTDQAGYRSGQTLLVNMPNWGYTNEEFLIQSVTSKLKPNGTTFEYYVIFAHKIVTLTTVFVGMMSMAAAVYPGDMQQTVHDLIIGVDDSMTMSDAAPTFTEHDNNWKWGPHDDHGHWNEASWR